MGDKTFAKDSKTRRNDEGSRNIFPYSDKEVFGSKPLGTMEQVCGLPGTVVRIPQQKKIVPPAAGRMPSGNDILRRNVLYYIDPDVRNQIPYTEEEIWDDKPIPFSC